MCNETFNEKDMILFQNLLNKHNKTITCAESCTGGLISSMITEISGSSNVFNGSIISYSNKIKNQELNVKNKTLESYGAVSVQTVKEMLRGSLAKFKANYSIAVSGIAGPNGGLKNKPIGTVVIGIADDSGFSDVQIYHFKGNRKEVQLEAAKTSLKKISNFVKKTLDK